SLLFSSTAPPPPEIYTLSLHDALPISLPDPTTAPEEPAVATPKAPRLEALYFALRNPKLVVGLSIVLLFLLVGLVVPPFLEHTQDRKSTRLNSSHVKISYAVFCLKKKK